MKPFIKTLIGDVRNVAVVGLVLGLGAATTLTGDPRAAWVALPVLTLCGIAYLAKH